MRFYTTIHLSEHISKTPEGYLLCCDVPIARTGVLSYAADELPEELAKELAEGAAKGQKVVQVRREAADLFEPSAMASYEGKPLTIDHPDVFVHPDNYREESRGHVQNVRRGEGAEDDLLLADILVMDEEAIALVERGLRELSCGYDADYETVRPGEVKQTNFVGNHVALVDRGRCGPRCAIKDSVENTMSGKTSWWDRMLRNPKVRRAMRDAEAEELKTGDDDAPTPAQDTGEEVESAPATDNADLAQKLDEITVLLRSLLERKGAADEDGAACDEDVNTADEDPGTTQDEDGPRATGDEDTPAATGKTGDRRRIADAALLRSATVLAPALRFRTGDSAALVQRASLRTAMQDADVSRVVTACLGRHTVDSAPGSLLNAAFVAASSITASKRNTRTADTLTGAKSRDSKGACLTPASINALNRDFYKK